MPFVIGKRVQSNGMHGVRVGGAVGIPSSSELDVDVIDRSRALTTRTVFVVDVGPGHCKASLWTEVNHSEQQCAVLYQAEMEETFPRNCGERAISHAKRGLNLMHLQASVV